MSTILDALRKVERDRPQTRREQLLELPRRHVQRRPLSLTLIGSFAALGFAAGIALALWRNARPLELAAIPSTPQARPIDVPAPAARPQAAARDAAGHTAASGPADVAAPAAPAAAENAAGMAGAPPVDAASAAGTVAAASEPPPAVADAASAPAPPAQVAAAEPAAPIVVPPVSPLTTAAEQTVGGGAVAPPNQAAPEVAGSALEPSPFARAGAAPPRAKPGAPAPAPEGAAEPPPNALAALVPAPPLPGSELPAAEPEPAPAPSPEVVIDTGRSPAGAPRLALTFLQWSNDPEHRFAFISVEGAPGQRVREGDTMAGMTVAQITPTGVQFRREGKLFMIRPRH